jgi:hypothetical protein
MVNFYENSHVWCWVLGVGVEGDRGEREIRERGINRV